MAAEGRDRRGEQPAGPRAVVGGEEREDVVVRGRLLHIRTQTYVPHTLAYVMVVCEHMPMYGRKKGNTATCGVHCQDGLSWLVHCYIYTRMSKA